MGDLLLTEEQWYERSFDCPCYIPNDKTCSAKQSMFLSPACKFDYCPFVFWLNAINIEK